MKTRRIRVTIEVTDAIGGELRQAPGRWVTVQEKSPLETALLQSAAYASDKLGIGAGDQVSPVPHRD